MQTLPSPEQTLIVAAQSIQQANTVAPYLITFQSGTRITVQKADVHDLATMVVRGALMHQAPAPVPPGNVVVLQIQGRTQSGRVVDVTLHSGATFRVPVDDISNPRLAFLRTALNEAIFRSRAGLSVIGVENGSTDVPTDAAAASVIRAKCAEDWPDDFRMRAYCQEQQDEGLRALRGRSMTGHANHQTIRKKCATDWPDDFRMRNYCEETQLKALRSIR
jgi:hypothetical protein